MTSPDAILRGPCSELTSFKICKRFEETVKLNEAKDALIFENDKLVRRQTYEELNSLANYLAKYIQNIVEQNNLKFKQQRYIIGVYMSASDYLIVTLLAIWKAGASYLPLDPNYSKDRIEYIIQDAKPIMIIYDTDEDNFLSTFSVNLSTVLLTYQFLPKADENILNEPEGDLAIVLYTSGSTGNPKGVCLSHTTLSNRLEWQFKNFPFSETEKVCVFKTVMTFVDSVFEIWAPLLKGLSVLVLPHTTITNSRQFITALEKYQIERIILVPTLLEKIALFSKTDKRRLLQSLRLCISSGEVLTERQVKQFYEIFSSETTQLCNFYGSTEVTDVTFHPITNASDFNKLNYFPLGGAVDNTIIYILDSNFQKCKEGEEGEIYISGLNVPLEYICSQHKTKLMDNPFETDLMFSKLYRIGDNGFIQNGVLYYKGRAGAAVKLKGYTIDLHEIDKVVGLVECVKKVVVLQHKEDILAFIEIYDLVTKQEIETFLENNLKHYMIPKVIIVKDIPLLVNGKTDRQLLLKSYEQKIVS